MSLNASLWAWNCKIKGGPKLVLLALADYADDDGHCFASTKKLADKCGFARSTICQHLTWLRVNHFIQSIRQSSKQGYRKANRYQLSLSPESDSQSPDPGQGGIRNPDRNIINSHKNSNKNCLYPESGLRLSKQKTALKGAI